LKQVAIVILNYNGRHYLEKFLPSVLGTTYANYTVIVADNASTDNSLAFLQTQGFLPHQSGAVLAHGSRYYLQLPKNYGFAEGYNRALAQIESDYFMLLNSDVAVSPDWLQPLVAQIETSDDVAAVQPKILMESQRDSFEHAGAAGGWIDKWGYPFCRGRIFDELETDKGQYDTTQAVFWASGAAMLIRADLYRQAGGLDADFFAHMEEIDLCWRLHRMGYSVYCVPASVVWHVGGGTLPKISPQKTYLNFRNSLCTIVKNVGGAWWIWVVWLRLLLDGVAGARFLFKGQFGNVWAIVRAHWRFFLWLPRMIARRRLPANADKKRPFNREGIYPKSIVFQSFIGKKNKFDQLF
jgi:GT2 family glycosyltransferase